MKRRRLTVVALAFVLAAGAGMLTLAACEAESESASGPANAPSSSSGAAVAVAQPMMPEDGAASGEQDLVDEEFAQSLSGFAYRSASAVLGDVGADAGMPANGAYSPLSLYYALALANEGAAGTTADQITSALGAPADVDVAGQCGSLFRALVANPDSKVALANSVWLGKDVPFEQDFVNSAVGQFYATPFSVEFGTAAADDALAAWISENTDGLVNPAIETDASQILAIVNAIAFKGSWLSPFDEAATQEDVFHAEGGDVQADFMTQRLNDPQEVRRTDAYLRASLGFGGGASMTFVLPAEGTSPADLLADPAALEEAFSAPADDLAFVTYTVPKAGFDSSLDLIPALERLGVREAFTDAADFSNLSSVSARISEVKQESHVTWDEEGAEAAAYTNVGIAKTALAPDAAMEVELRLDRPFLFQITSAQGVPLFVGMCGNPAEAS
ncbi:serpin family protein [Rubneribacter sp.]|nr:serpin family protein [Candidatus Rubneribacter avistercoris]